MSTTPREGELGYEFPHPGNGRTLRVVRADALRVKSAAEECSQCAVRAECASEKHPHHAALSSACGFDGDFTKAPMFVAYVDDIPVLTVKGLLA